MHTRPEEVYQKQKSCGISLLQDVTGDADTSVCTSTGEDARHRYLTPGLIMQATNGVLSCPIHLGPLLLLCHGPCVAAERLLPRRCDNAGQSNARDARHPGRMLRNKQSRNPTPKKEESLPRR